MIATLLVVAGLVALGLLVLLQVRVTARQQALEQTVERMRGMHRDMATDVRKRLEEAHGLVDAVEGEVRPKVEALEAALADVSASLDENLPALREGRRRLEQVEEGAEAIEARVTRVLGTAAQETREVLDRMAAEVEALRDALEGRLEELGTRVGDVEERIGAWEAGSVAAEQKGPRRESLEAAGGPDGVGATARGPRGRAWLVLAVALAGVALAYALGVRPFS